MLRVLNTGGERGIRTPGPVTVNSFQDCRNRPLCHFSNKSGQRVSLLAVANIATFFDYRNIFYLKMADFCKVAFKCFILMKLKDHWHQKI